MSKLWPDSFKEKEIRSPKAILEEQTKFLSKLTNDLIYATVSDTLASEAYSKDLSDYDFSYSFCIKGQFLDKYKFVVLYIAYDVVIYPATIVLDNEISDEIKIDRRFSVDSEKEFIDIIKLILHSKKIENIIGSIMALS